MTTERICKCGKTFEVPYPSSKRLNCSAKCRGVKTKTRADAGTRKTMWVVKTCPCGTTFEVPRWGARENKSKVYCSAPCREKYRQPIKGRPARVVSQRRVTAEGYVMVYVPPDQRPPGWAKSHVPEHRMAMAQVLGRHLLPDENVHHINGVKADNRAENLELWTTKQPKGQRVTDLVEFAREILARYDNVEGKS